MSCRNYRIALAACYLFLAALATSARAGTPFVPGTGEFLADCSDDFEDPDWKYILNLPKSSNEQDDNTRSPGGFSKQPAVA